MQYLGGKGKLGKKIADVVASFRKPGQLYIEPFVGSGWVTIHIPQGTGRICSDAHPDLIALHKAIQDGWEPPSFVSEQDYESAKQLTSPSAIKGFIGFGCSFGGKWFGGYARSASRSYAANARNSLLRKRPFLLNATFECRDYSSYCDLTGALIYCDPPYSNSTTYKGVSFDSKVFWETVRTWSRLNTVIVSEYSAPSDFECIANFDTSISVRSRLGREARVERLFKMRDSVSDVKVKDLATE